LSKYIFVWEKTKDPYGTIQESDLADEREHSEDHFPEEDDYGHFELDNEEDKGRGPPNVKPLSGLFTGAGFVALNEYTDTFKLFNFWTGHTNFGITKRIRRIIAKTEGVEMIHVFSRYRFRIAVGRVFKASGVCNEISKRVREYLENKQPA
jgi:hypothetical protein